MSIIDTLTTDRTQAGYYNITDLNRVGEAMSYVVARLWECGYGIEISPRTNWAWTDLFGVTAANSLLVDLRKIRATMTALPTTPSVPTGERPFNAQEANDIERILAACDDALDRMAKSWFYPSEIYGGEV